MKVIPPPPPMRLSAPPRRITALLLGPLIVLGLLFGFTAAQAASCENFSTTSSDNFITTWRAQANDAITFPGKGSYCIDWGDGTTETVNDSTDHTYDADGTYDITVSPTITRFNLNNGADRVKLISVKQWGTARWSSMEDAFYGASNMQITATDNPDLSTVTSMGGMFRDAAAFNSDIGDWNVSKVRSMQGMFSGAAAFNQDIGRWDVGEVIHTLNMFSGAAAFNQDIGRWDVSNAREMHGMFFNARAFNQDIGRWDVSKVWDMSFMFTFARSFNQDISGWDVSNIGGTSGMLGDMDNMFTNARSFRQNLGRWYIPGTIKLKYDSGTGFFKALITAQNDYLNGQSPQYTLVEGTGDDDNTKFTLTDGTLSIKAAEARIGSYEIRIAAGSVGFGRDNARAITVTVPESNDASLSGLSLSQGTLNPGFHRDTTDYTAADVADSIASLTVTPTAIDSGATVTVNNASVTSGTPSGDILLTAGAETNIAIIVTAADGMAKQTYTVTVPRAASSDARLSGLRLSQGTLNPGFHRDTTDYTADVDNSIDSLTVTPTANDSGAGVTVNGNSVANGPINLNVGSNPITIEVTAADGSTQTYTIIVTRAASDMRSLISETILPEVARGMVDQTMGAIGQRTQQARTNDRSAASYNFGGGATLPSALAASASEQEGGLDMKKTLKKMFNGAAFAMPLNAAEGGARGGLTLWGDSSYRSQMGTTGAVSYDGELGSLHLGIDGRPRADVLLGLALSFSDSSFDYSGSGQGEYSVEMNSAHPYIGWSAGNLDYTASLGYGKGEITISPNDTNRQKTTQDAYMRTATLGASGDLRSSGTSTLRLKGEFLTARIDVTADEETPALLVDANRFRLSLEGANERTLANGAAFHPSLEIGVRHDDGDGKTGAGVELGGGLSYFNPATGVTIEGRVRGLVAHAGDYQEWGLSGLVKFAPGADGQGLSLSLSPGYGDSSGGIGQLWHGLPEAGATQRDYSMRMAMRLDYGLSATVAGGRLTPYGEMTLGDNNRYRTGVRWQLGSQFAMDLVGEHRQQSDAAENSLLLKARISF